MKVGVSTILIFRCAEHLTLVVGFHRGRSRQDLCPCHQMKVDIVLQADAAAEIGASRQQHLSTAINHTSIDSLVDCYMVERLTITLGTIITYIIFLRLGTERQEQ